MIEQDRKEWVVISSDREIMDHAWNNSSVPVPSAQFLSRLEQSIHLNRPQLRLGKNGNMLTDGDNEQPADDEDDDMRQKGSSRQRSKREKALMRVLRKL